MQDARYTVAHRSKRGSQGAGVVHVGAEVGRCAAGRFDGAQCPDNLALRQDAIHSALHLRRFGTRAAVP